MTVIQPKTIRDLGRPFALDPLFRGLQTLTGVGAKSLPLLEKLLTGTRIVDLLFHKPIDVIDRTYRPKLAQAREGRVATITIIVEEHRPPKRAGLPYKIICSDETGFIDLIFFNVRGNYLEGQYPVNAGVMVSGKMERFGGKWQMAHPDKITSDAEMIKYEPVYPLTAGITHKQLNKCVSAALPLIPDLPEWLDLPLKRQQKWDDFAPSLRQLHRPEGESDLAPSTPIRGRLAYDELLADQLAIALIRTRERGVHGRSFQPDPRLRNAFLSALPFQLTRAQKRSVDEITADMAAPLRMMRLLQGDVGSGKTVVAAIAMLNAIACGAQAAIMAPTEILAHQHAATLTPLLEKIGVRTAILTGRHKGSERAEILSRIADGSAQAIIGTHALFQEDVVFSDLGLTIIDEQHRFGVHQRLHLSAKGTVPDVLVMTATPIPRTLALTAYGDLDISVLNEKPPGRKPVDTRLIPLPRFDEMITGLRNQLKDGVQVYWVCPLVEESETLDLAAAEARYDDLRARLPDIPMGLVHGRMRPKEKDAVMHDFSDGKIKLLVATTVIEVGVNVPTASIMVIEHAERYGLAQLHQLRGRVGRGALQSYCFLMYNPECTQVAKERLKIMRESEDGFYIAEKDLSLRGAGDILGTRQSGLAAYRLADLGAHSALLDIARDDARLIVEKDPRLATPRGEALRHLLYLFQRDRAIKLLYSG